MAVFCLPPEMVGFYKIHMDYITEHAVDPDRRRNKNPDEAPRHYIDADHYGLHPFDSIPKWWGKAVEKYTEDTLNAYGIVPWYIEKMVERLTEAFKEENKDKILRLSADLGHYTADAFVPLHTTENYNGQLTNQKGIHGLWESRIPELKAENYDYFLGRAKYIDNPIDKAWYAVKTSYAEKDSVLLFEAGLNKNFPSDKKYSHVTEGKKISKTYSEEYVFEYDKLLNGMVERRMRASIITVSSLWYTAWVNAGKPDLNKLLDTSITDAVTDTNQIVKPHPLKGHEDE